MSAYEKILGRVSELTERATPIFTAITMSPRRAIDENGAFLWCESVEGDFIAFDVGDEAIWAAKKWRVMDRREGTSKYVLGRQFELFHRLIMSAPKGASVDHGDWNGLNCRRYNLQVLTGRQNAWRARMGSPRHGNVSKTGFRGVLATESGKFSAHITLNCKSYYLGVFLTAEEAARAWDERAYTERGRFAVLNFPHEYGL